MLVVDYLWFHSCIFERCCYYQCSLIISILILRKCTCTRIFTNFIQQKKSDVDVLRWLWGREVVGGLQERGVGATRTVDFTKERDSTLTQFSPEVTFSPRGGGGGHCCSKCAPRIAQCRVQKSKGHPPIYIFLLLVVRSQSWRSGQSAVKGREREIGMELKEVNRAGEEDEEIVTCNCRAEVFACNKPGVE